MICIVGKATMLAENWLYDPFFGCDQQSCSKVLQVVYQTDGKNAQQQPSREITNACTQVLHVSSFAFLHISKTYKEFNCISIPSLETGQFLEHAEPLISLQSDRLQVFICYSRLPEIGKIQNDYFENGLVLNFMSCNTCVLCALRYRAIFVYLLCRCFR